MSTEKRIIIGGPSRYASEELRQPLPTTVYTPPSPLVTTKRKESFEWWTLPGENRRRRGHPPLWMWIFPPMWLILIPMYLLYAALWVIIFLVIVLPVNIVRLVMR